MVNYKDCPLPQEIRLINKRNGKLGINCTKRCEIAVGVMKDKILNCYLEVYDLIPWLTVPSISKSIKFYTTPIFKLQSHYGRFI